MECVRPARARVAALALVVGLFFAASVDACGHDDVAVNDAGTEPSAEASAGDSAADASADSAPGNRSCAAQGGSCGSDGRGVTINDCRTTFGTDGGAGYLSDLDCPGTMPGRTCCFAACAGARDFDCCANGTTFIPGCIDGHVACMPGTQKQAQGSCLRDAAID